MDAAEEITIGYSRKTFVDLGELNNNLFEYNNKICLWDSMYKWATKWAKAEHILFFYSIKEILSWQNHENRTFGATHNEENLDIFKHIRAVIICQLYRYIVKLSHKRCTGNSAMLIKMALLKHRLSQKYETARPRATHPSSTNLISRHSQIQDGGRRDETKCGTASNFTGITTKLCTDSTKQCI